MATPMKTSTKQHFFVVVATQDSDGSWSFDTDDETLNVRFPDGPVWDWEKDEWEHPVGEDQKADHSLLAMLWKKLR